MPLAYLFAPAPPAVYLGLCADENEFVRMKPQNLLLNLPLNEA